MKMSDVTWPAHITAVSQSHADALAHQLADHVALQLTTALEERPRASLAVSGGSTPKAFFAALSRQVLPWERVDITLVDERWVSPDDRDSNERLVREYLLIGYAASARFIGLRQPGTFGGDGQQACEQALQAFSWPLDVLILGMGNDGHTASFFPDAPELPQALDPNNTALSLALTPPSQAHRRVSLTFSVMSHARFRALHLKGDDKLATLARAFADLEQIPEMPVRAFLKDPMFVFWSP
ncbi:6-phosphogluconolactonase [Marinobacter caseinilyticus]|uniref:6-phosphogluconolactonase n=1 Tax=Marinobacter caseinilyticus TaxID=2692195 RepID=UPI001F280412|nr:6-phosphogluconolactonase [Marinobacter caseinilyticus]